MQDISRPSACARVVGGTYSLFCNTVVFYYKLNGADPAAHVSILGNTVNYAILRLASH